MGEYAPLAHAAIDEILAAGRTPLVVGGTGLYFRAALAELELPPAPAPTARASGGSGSTTTTGPRLLTRALRELDPPRRRECTRTTAGASSVRSSSRRPGVARPGVETAVRRRLAASDRRRRSRRPEAELDRADRGADDGACSKPASRKRCATRSPSRAVRRPRGRCIGLDEVATLPREEAIEALIVRTRRYAAYQRKWMRRLEGLVMVAADRPPEETAAEIVDAGTHTGTSISSMTGRRRPPTRTGTDGVVEVLAVDGDEVDGRHRQSRRLATRRCRATARASQRRGSCSLGRPTSRECASASATVEVRRVGDGQYESEMGAVEVWHRRVVARHRADRRSRSGIRTPSSSAIPNRIGELGPLLESDPRFPERTNVQVARVDAAWRGDRPRLGARRGGDDGVRDERGRGCGRDARRRRSARPLPGRRPPRPSRRRPRVAHRAGGAARGIAGLSLGSRHGLERFRR